MKFEKFCEIIKEGIVETIPIILKSEFETELEEELDLEKILKELYQSLNHPKLSDEEVRNYSRCFSEGYSFGDAVAKTIISDISRIDYE